MTTTKWIVAGLVALVAVGIAIAVPYSLSLIESYRAEESLKDSRTPEEVAAQKSELVFTEDTQALAKLAKDSSKEARGEYLAGVDGRLAAEGITEGTRKMLLLRKAVVLEVVRGTPEEVEANMAEAVSIFKQFLTSAGNTPEDLFFRDYSIVGLVHSQLQCCSTDPTLMQKYESYVTYKKLGYNDTLAALLAMNDLTKKMSSERKDDLVNGVNAMDVQTKVLLGYRGELKKETFDALLAELGRSIEALHTLRGHTYGDNYVRMTVEPISKSIVAYDVYEWAKNAKISPATNKEIDRRYEVFSEGLRKSLAAGQDAAGVSEVLLYHQIRYLESLSRRYGTAASPQQVKSLVESTLELMRSNKDIEGVAVHYIRGLDALQKADPAAAKQFVAFSHFISLGKTHKALGEYLSALGVTL